ncbi:type II toxin-antitoxin system PemK/MazF family toxin [Enterococcus sp. DIV1288f]|uniref:type II toxin-antitoxin system PemK/MazF family toxin n=1 Tax=Enterococcus sp. DIV1288f TaxID=2774823 RepID=UPI003F685AD3
MIWLNSTPSFGREIRGEHPTLVVSSNAYNKKTNCIIVCPVTTGGNNFSGYVSLNDYKKRGRVHARQIHSFDTDRIISKEFIDRLRGDDFLQVKQILDYSLEIDF